ncbi:AMP-binding protein [Paracoccus sp. pheM1]|uniref:AMP-binding protein n=1 Tax=Paracoccus sp. pheM1 TaxID=2831675 RepID=UPI001BDB6E64|nr:AMP-binding protein [Paracoccus sp. pheM1]MBT0782975.1 AMP-binding protein [Paracoccus sp. pheM1]
MRMTSVLHNCEKLHSAAPAVIHGDRIITWKEVVRRVRLQAGMFTALGVRPGDRVAVLALNNDRYFELLYSVPWMGGAIVPLNTRWSLDELDRAIKDCGPPILVVDDAFLDMARRLIANNPGLRGIFIGEAPCPEGFLELESELQLHPPVDEHHGSGDDVWGVMYTGGTTGHPKGVTLTHTNVFLAGLFLLSTCGYTDATRYLHICGFFHIISTMPLVAISVAGGCHVIEPKFDPVPTMAVIERHKVNASTFVPTMINMMLHHPEFDRYDLTSMGKCIYGGSPIPDVLIELMIQKLPTWEFIQGYGQTEVAGILTCLPWAAHFGEGSANKRRATGRSVYGAHFKLVDPDGNEVPAGVSGEVVVRGLNVMKGYWNNPKATGEAIRDGWLHTGDVAVMDEDGYITVVDRLKDMIVSGGENVYSVEVENALRSHPAVQECAVIGRPDPRWGEAVHAVVVLKPRHTASESELIAHSHSRIANYKCPRSVEILEEMPMSAAGKIQKGHLRERFWAEQNRRVH